jgi:hypothetical protein
LPKIVAKNRLPLGGVTCYVAFTNLCRTHEALPMTPAMAARITYHVRSIAELVAAALKVEPAKPTPAQRRRSSRVIQLDLFDRANGGAPPSR